MAEPTDSVLGGARTEPSAEDRLRALVASAPVGIFEMSLDGQQIYTNERARRLAALSPGTTNRRAWLESLHPQDRDRVEGEWAAAAAAGREFELEYRFLNPDGKVVWVAGRGAAIRDDEGNATGYLGTITDITERKRADAARLQAEEQFRRAFEDSASGMAMIEARGRQAGRFSEVNEALTRMSGYSAAELLLMTYWDLVHPDELDSMRRGVVGLLKGKADTFHAELRMICAGGIVKWIAFNVSLVRNAGGAPLSAVVQAQDVTERKRFETELQFLADHDPLTSLYNRRRFGVELEREIAAAERYGTGGAILVLDLDNFKLVNDTLGHTAGDELLTAAARAIQGRLRGTDIVARLGGDEFGIILPHADKQRAILVAESLREVVRTVVGIEAGLSHVTASVGIVTFGGDGEQLRGGERMVTDADTAMYAAKQAGRDRVRIFGDGETHAALRLA